MPSLRKAASRLRRHCPLDGPVRIRRRNLGEHHRGWCRECGKGFVIEVCSDQSYAAAAETLAHEWAHAMTWGGGGKDHNSEWGRAYARCYRAVFENSA